ncbi:MAG: hypothetical protein ACI97A_003093 [Planctomycetota bacterium]|jgi:uncharacterized protein (DUF58 family)
MNLGIDLLDSAFLARLEKLDIVARKILSGEFRGDVRTRRRGAGSLFRGHKSYSQGDDLRFLDWNVYSRLGELLVKQFDAEENLNLLLVVDASGSMDFGGNNKMIFAQKVAAALSFIALNRHARVDLAILPQDKKKGSAPFFGRNAIGPLFQRLGSIEAGGDFDLQAELRGMVGKRRGRGVALVLSDFFAESGYSKPLQFLRHQGYRVGALHVLDREELRPKLHGRTKLVDIESSKSMKRDVSKQMIDAYEDEVRNWCQGVETFCAGNDIAYARLDTAWTLERVVTQALLRGGVLA